MIFYIGEFEWLQLQKDVDIRLLFGLLIMQTTD